MKKMLCIFSTILCSVGFITGSIACAETCKKTNIDWCIERIEMRENYSNIDYFSYEEINVRSLTENIYYPKNYLITTYKERSGWVMKTEWSCTLWLKKDTFRPLESNIHNISCSIFTEDIFQLFDDKDKSWREEHDSKRIGYGLSWQIQIKDFFKKIGYYLGVMWLTFRSNCGIM